MAGSRTYYALQNILKYKIIYRKIKQNISKDSTNRYARPGIFKKTDEHLIGKGRFYEGVWTNE